MVEIFLCHSGPILSHVLHECIYHFSFDRNILISIFVLKYLLSHFQPPARTSPPTIPDASPLEEKIALPLSRNSCSETSPAEINVNSYFFYQTRQQKKSIYYQNKIVLMKHHQYTLIYVYNL